MTEVTVTKQDVEDAFAILNDIKKGNEAEAIKNAMPSTKGDGQADAQQNATSPTKGDAEKLAKENFNKSDEEDEVDSMKKSMGDMKKDMSEMKKSMDTLCKMVENLAANGGQTTQLAKSFEAQESKVDQIAKSIGIVMKDQTDKLDAISKSHDSLMDRLDTVEKTPLSRKSVTGAAYVEKSFDNNNDLEKGQEGMTILAGREQITTQLDSLSGITKGEYNQFYGDALLNYEATGTLTKAVVDDLRMNHKIIVRQ